MEKKKKIACVHNYLPYEWEVKEKLLALSTMHIGKNKTFICIHCKDIIDVCQK